jgi:hypothetical protein
MSWQASSTQPRVLFLHANSEDYMADSLLHGLRSVLGAGVVDVPRCDALYDDLPPERRRQLYGRGFTLYARLPEVDVDRQRWLYRVLAGEFDLVVFADIWRYWAPWVQLRPRLAELRRGGVTLVAVDGGDGVVLYPHGPSWWRQMRPWPLPRVAGRIEVFKRELAPSTAWVRSYGLLPPRVAERVLLRSVRPLAFSIPEERLATGAEDKDQLLATHVVDPDVARLRPQAQTSYAFDSEDDYYADLRRSRFGVTMKKAGWETLRHYEIAASGCVPCFRDLHRKPPRTAPFGLDETNCVSYTDAGQLLERITAMGEHEYASLRSGALEWARRNTTRARAHQFLAALGRGVERAPDANPVSVVDA